jgi:formylmethanofuran dehydrogenase subunit E
MDKKIINKIETAIHNADEMFETAMDSSMHWVRDCLIPCLEDQNLTICEIERTHKCDKCGELFAANYIASNDDKTWICVGCIMKGN